MTVSDNGASTPRDYLYGFINDKDPIRKPDESQIVMWRTPDGAAKGLTLHGLKGYTHYGGVHLQQLEEAGSGVFTLSSQGVSTKLEVEAATYKAIQELVRSGDLEELLKLLKRENIYQLLARQEN